MSQSIIFGRHHLIDFRHCQSPTFVAIHAVNTKLCENPKFTASIIILFNAGFTFFLLPLIFQSFLAIAICIIFSTSILVLFVCRSFFSFLLVLWWICYLQAGRCSGVPQFSDASDA